MANRLTESLRDLLELALPTECLLCHSLLKSTIQTHSLCQTCYESLRPSSFSSCLKCASTIGPGTDSTGGCVKCRRESFAFSRVIRFGVYEGSLREAVLRMKWLNGESLAETLGHRWFEQDEIRFRDLTPEIVVPVPLHWLRRIRRGYNQADALATVLANRLGVPCGSYVLRRLRNTQMQSSQSASARRENLRGAFVVRQPSRVVNKRILLIDDVLTTGSTAHESARALLSAGAAQVLVAVLAHR